MSDCDAVGDAYSKHHYTKDAPTAVRPVCLAPLSTPLFAPHYSACCPFIICVDILVIRFPRYSAEAYDALTLDCFAQAAEGINNGCDQDCGSTYKAANLQIATTLYFALNPA